MEFGYDLTDLSAGFDRSRPLKYFFIINSKTKSGQARNAKGSGHLYNVSVLDYEFDKEGVETPFVLEKKEGENSVAIDKGTIAMYSTIVYGEQFFAPTNANVSNNKFTWSAPQANGHKIKEYKVFVNGTLRGTTQELSYPVTDAGSYGVTAVYEGGHETSMVSAISSVARQEKNVAVDLKKTGFTIPDVFKESFPDCTIEFWIKPHSVSDWNQQGGPGWGTFMCHANADGTYTAGWDAVGNARANAASALRVNKWSHIAMVVQKSNFRLYVNGAHKGSAPSAAGHSGLGGFGNLVFAGGSNGQDAVYDEIRIWNKARNNNELSSAHTTEFSGELMPQGLVAYYKGDIIMIDGKPYLRDCVGGHHAPINGAGYEQVNSDQTFREPSGRNFTFSGTSIAGAKTVEAGQPLLLKANYQDQTKELEWSAPDANVEKYAGTELTVVFPKEGTYKVTLTVKDGDKSRTAEKEITVTPAAACSADFVASLTQVPAGQRVSFNPVNPVAGYQYAWSMPGGNVSASNAVSAGTTYETPGKHEVTLTVTSATGEVKTSKQVVNVVNVAPEAAFSINNPVVLKNEKGTMTNESKFRPSQLEWIFNSGKNVLVKKVELKDKKDNELPYEVKQPGVYDVTLKASNEVGKSETTQLRGLTVVNADSKNGLSFNHIGASVVLSKQPIAKDTKNFTIDWWMNPAKLSDFCCGIGDLDATFQIKTDYRGRLQISKNGLTVLTNEGTVKAGEWHHYAVCVNNGSNVKVYCDGEQVATTGYLSGSQMPNLSRFTIGNESADMSGQIDEFRVWEKALPVSTLRKYANVPLEGELLDKAKSEDKLILYYNFNQTSGNVVDQSGNGYEGVRKNFGPEGDAWGLSRGVFSLNFEDTMEDVSSELKNNHARFDHTNKKVNGSNSRWLELKDWLLENTNKSGNVTAGAHYDNMKGGAFTVTSGWDGFPDLKDHKVYQVLHLKAGAYALTTSFGQHGESANCFLVAALGNKLPDSNQLDKSLASTPLNPGPMGAENTLNFVLTEDTDVALGIVANMIGNKIFCIHNFKLVRNSVETITTIGGVKTNVQSTKAEGTYDLSGRRVEKTESGQIYIQNGQRVVAQ
jgi:FOG: PKD repeat